LEAVSAVKAETIKELVASESLATLCDSLVRGNAFQEEIRGFKRVLMESGQTTTSASLLAILKDLSTFEDPLQHIVPSSLALFVPGAEVPEPPSLPQAFAMLDLRLCIHEVALSIAFLKSHAFGSGGCLLDRKIKPEVDAAVAFLDDLLATFATKLSDSVCNGVKQLRLPWTFTVEDCENFLVAATLFSLVAKRFILLALMDSAFNLAESVSSHTPLFSHIVTASVYHSKLAQKSLLKGQENERLTSETLALFVAMGLVAQVHQEWHMQPPLAEDVELAEKRAFCDSAFRVAKQALIIIAAVTVLETKKPDQSGQEAENLLKKRKAELPAPLIELLQKFVEIWLSSAQGKAAKRSA
jgi:hypothetical protein